MGIRWQLFSREDALTEVGTGLWAHTWASKKRLYGVLPSFRPALGFP